MTKMEKISFSTHSITKDVRKRMFKLKDMLPNFILFRRSSFCCLQHFSLSPRACFFVFLFLFLHSFRIEGGLDIPSTKMCLLSFYRISMSHGIRSGFSFQTFTSSLTWQVLISLNCFQLNFVFRRGETIKNRKKKIETAGKVLQHRTKCIRVTTWFFSLFFFAVFSPRLIW